MILNDTLFQEAMIRLQPREKPLGLLDPTSRIIESPSHHMEKGQELLGSDGETSDYQRSTPSPRDTDSRITELGSNGSNNKLVFV